MNTKKTTNRFGHLFEVFSNKVTKAAGSSWAFILALFIVLVWLFTGPLFHYSNTWQLMINTGTTIVTFLMVFLIQQSQNKDTTALHLKLNELISATTKADNKLIDIEDLTEEDLGELKDFYIRISEKLKKAKSRPAKESIAHKGQ